jgi:hypothetical protein
VGFIVFYFVSQEEGVRKSAHTFTKERHQPHPLFLSFPPPPAIKALASYIYI